MKKMGCAKCGKSMKRGGAKKMAKGGNTFIAGIPNAGPTGPNYQGIDTMKRGGAMSKINRAVKPGCRGGMVKDANGNCVEVRMAKKGMNFKDLSGDGKITRKDVLIGRGVIPKKAIGGPILDKLKAKLAAAKAKFEERKVVTKTIKKGLKTQYKQKKKLGL